MQCSAIVLMFFAQFLPISTQVKPTWYDEEGGKKCNLCPAGEFQKSCTECKPCPAGSYSTLPNREGSCHRCYGDCRPDKHLKVVQNCTSKSNVKCVCEAGYSCTDYVPLSNNCRYCVRIKEASSTDNIAYNRRLAAILCPIIVIGFLALVILLVFRCHGDESCLKPAMSKLCNEGGRDGSHKLREPTHQLPRDSFSAKQQPSSLSATNLGPVHVHNPGTVIFSLLNQFTGQVGPTIEGVKTVKRGCSKEEDVKDCPVFQPTSSTRVHLSEEEERSTEMDSTFLPSQEDGKDWHMSKEEVL